MYGRTIFETQGGGRIMAEDRTVQKEVLGELVEFNENVIKNMKIITKELDGKRLDDTDEFLNGIIKGINWEIQVVNGTISLLNEDKERLNKSEFEEKVRHLGDAYGRRSDCDMKTAFEELIPMFENLGEAAKEVCV